MSENQEVKQRPVVSEEFAGKWVAWSSGGSLKETVAAAKSAGEADPAFEWIPPANARRVGAIRSPGSSRFAFLRSCCIVVNLLLLSAAGCGGERQIETARIASGTTAEAGSDLVAQKNIKNETPPLAGHLASGPDEVLGPEKKAVTGETNSISVEQAGAETVDPVEFFGLSQNHRSLTDLHFLKKQE